MLILSHPANTEYLSALLAGCEQAGVDFQFHTTVAFTQNSWQCKLSPAGLRRELLRRVFPVSPARIHTWPKRELTRLVAQAMQISTLTAPGKGWASTENVLQEFDTNMAAELHNNRHYRLKARAVHAYEDYALKTFQMAHDVKIKCSYELALPYWETSQRLLKEEAARWPDWGVTLSEKQESAAKQQQRAQELALADMIFCPSQFVLRSLPEAAQKKCTVAEFGSPEISHFETRSDAMDFKRPLRLLFVGQLTQRKGLADLFAAMRLLNRRDVELYVSGAPVASLDFYRKQYAGFHYETPASRHELLLLMQRCDVLVLPSIVEGRALVQQEAMSCGLPLIVTPNAGGEDLIEPEKTGLLVPIREPEKLAEAIAWFADHRTELPLMSEHARRKATACTWDVYARKILAVLAPG